MGRVANFLTRRAQKAVQKPVENLAKKGLGKVLANPSARLVIGGVAGGAYLDAQMRKKPAEYGYDNTYTGGDLWPNPCPEIAALEQKCFKSPKVMGCHCG